MSEIIKLYKKCKSHLERLIVNHLRHVDSDTIDNISAVFSIRKLELIKVLSNMEKRGLIEVIEASTERYTLPS